MRTALLNAWGSACLIVVLLLAVTPVHAQLTPADIEDTGPQNTAYTDSLRGVKADVIYLRPGAAFVPSDDVEIEVPKPPEEQRTDLETERWVWIALFAAVLVFVLFMVARYGGGISVSLGSAPKDGSRSTITDAEREAAAVLRQPMEQFLDTIRAMTDRREALILLVSRAIERAAETNQIRLGRAQTARDALRILPRSWEMMPALRRLVREVEVVHFGGRDLPEDTWAECLELAAPIIQPTRSA